MCGIFGCLHLEPDEVPGARNALHELSHRGPDQWGDWFVDGTYLGHRRLSILDLSDNALQPFVDEANQVAVAVNGEIYNFKDLRRTLGEQRFRSRSDSEVVLHGYLDWGIEKLLSRIDGMFALAVFDGRSRRLHLARDRFGKKPMFFALSRGRFVFASEIKALLKFDDSLRVFSLDGVKDWIAHRGGCAGSTIFHGVQRLLPGCFLTVGADLQYQVRRYYDLVEAVIDVEEGPDLAEQEVCSLVQGRLREAVDRRLVADVPIGLQLSGGVDSSLLALVVRRELGRTLHTFSVVFDEPGSELFNEEAYSRRVADMLGLQHHALSFQKAEAAASFEKLVYLTDGMLDYPNTIPIYLLSRFCRDRVKVVLTGEGADELFGGYSKYSNAVKLLRPAGWQGSIPEGILRFLPFRVGRTLARQLFLVKQYGNQPAKILNNLNSYVSVQTIEKVFGPVRVTGVRQVDLDRLAHLPFERQLLVVDHLTYLASLLDRQDRASMGAGVEARLPYLDRRLVEWAMALSTDLFFDHRRAKIPLKSIAAEAFGKKFAHRRKMGFPLPVARWLEDPEGFGTFYRRLFDDNFVLDEVMDRSTVRKFLTGRDEPDRHLLNYADSERMWLGWYLMVLRTAQDVFKVRGVAA